MNGLECDPLPHYSNFTATPMGMLPQSDADLPPERTRPLKSATKKPAARKSAAKPKLAAKRQPKPKQSTLLDIVVAQLDDAKAEQVVTIGLEGKSA
ncbi:MAG: hypothetical protein HC855_14195, partial [Rhizobiales bacterium]|nr:hypothetical protein [Hyphomicrobiales bacterium]